MKTRKLNITIKLPDNDITQYELEKTLEGVLGKENITDLRVLPNTDHLKDNEHFKSLIKAERKAKELKYDFINNNR